MLCGLQTRVQMQSKGVRLLIYTVHYKQDIISLFRVDSCTDPNCVNVEFVNDVNNTLANSANYAKPVSPNAQFRAASVSYVPPGRVDSDVCRFFLQGNCRFGSACRYKHPQK